MFKHHKSCETDKPGGTHPYTLATDNSNNLKPVYSRVTSNGNLKLQSVTSKFIGKVVKDSNLGRGQFGVVKIILLGENKTVQAVKIKEKSTNNGTENCFHNYVLTHNLQSHLLVPYKVFIDENHTLYEVMQLANFGDGNKLIKSLAQLNEQQEQLIKRHVMLSLIEAHVLMNKHGINHLDLKPENILFDDEGRCYVSDFDFSIILEPNGNYYRKPEEIKLERKFCPRHFPLELDTSETRRFLFNSLDAYRLGLTCLLIYCKVKPEQITDSNFRELNPDDLKKMLEEHNVPHEASVVIMGLLKDNLIDRMTIEEASQAVTGWELTDNEVTQVQTIFSNWCRPINNAKNTSASKNSFFRNFHLVASSGEGNYLHLEKINAQL